MRWRKRCSERAFTNALRDDGLMGMFEVVMVGDVGSLGGDGG